MDENPEDMQQYCWAGPGRAKASTAAAELIAIRGRSVTVALEPGSPFPRRRSTLSRARSVQAEITDVGEVIEDPSFALERKELGRAVAQCGDIRWKPMACHSRNEALGNGQVARYLLDVAVLLFAEWPILEMHPDAAL
jgi:hypothetical protein